jgi:hypothetical protein
MTQPFIALRLYVACSMFVTASIAAGEPESMLWKALSTGHPAGVVLLGVAFVASFVAMLDTIINDVLPSKYVLYGTKRWRHLGFMFLAILSSAEAFFILKNFGPSTILLRYMLDAIAATCVTFLGLRELVVFPNIERRRRA